MLKSTIIITLLVFLSLNIGGCVPLLVAGGVAGGAGTQTWLSGKLVQDIDAPFEEAIQAAESALGALNLDIVSEVKKARVAQIKSNYIDGETIWVDIHKITQSISRIAVRVGAVSDQEAAVEILSKIKEYLNV
ncbi:MAG: DUF3568 family protein [Candidatus Omnitrophota bacterium]|jgi:hypothetical protein